MMRLPARRYLCSAARRRDCPILQDIEIAAATTTVTAQKDVMRIELLISPGCPNADAARRVIADCLADLGIDVLVIDRVGQYRSPTVLVDGVDVMRPQAGSAER